MGFTRSEIACDLGQLKYNIESSLDQARGLLRQAPKHIAAAAECWLSNITIQISKEHNYLAGTMCTMAETIEALEASECDCEFCGESANNEQTVHNEAPAHICDDC
jgi:hypothetical protein